MKRGRKPGVPNRERTARPKKDEDRPVTESHINEHIKIMREIGFPDSILDNFRLRLKRECKTKADVNSMVTRMKLDYFEEVWTP